MKEIERKFLVKDFSVIKGCKFDQIQQSYLFNEYNKSLRIRIKNDYAFITIKGNQIGMTRDEFEYQIPKEEALEIIARFELKVLSKKRYYLNSWEIDVFEGSLNGLIVAEIEIPSENHVFEIPGWIGEEVTHDPSYLNAELFKKL
ncbi:MAG: CYTH domain-containing protein [Bacteroidota bacterium]